MKGGFSYYKNEYNIIKHFDINATNLEDLILNYFQIHLETINDNYE